MEAVDWLKYALAFLAALLFIAFSSVGLLLATNNQSLGRATDAALNRWFRVLRQPNLYQDFRRSQRIVLPRWVGVFLGILWFVVCAGTGITIMVLLISGVLNNS